MKTTKSNKLKYFSFLLSILIIFGLTTNSFAGYSYLVYSGSGSSYVDMRFGGQGSPGYIQAYYNSGPNPGTVYVPEGMTAGRIVINYLNEYTSSNSSWNYNTIAHINLYLKNTDGSEIFWQTISLQPWKYSSGSTITIGDFYLSSNYRGVRIGEISAYLSNYMPSYATSTNQGYFNFDFYNLAFAETEEQFNYLTNKTVEASLNALNAYNAANSANTAAQQAKTSADAAKTSADTAATRAQTTINQTWYSGKYGGTAESTADITGYIRNTQLPNLETKINNLQTSVTNIQNADNLPPSVEIDTVSGAKATSSSSIQLIVAASDNKSSTFTYSVNGGGYSSLPADGKITVSLPAVGPNTVTVRVKDDAGNVTTKTIKIWRLS